MTGTFGGTYNTGTMTLTNGSGVAAFSGTLMTVEAEVDDFIYVNPLNLMIRVTDVTDDTHLGISPNWGGTTQTNINYTLMKMSPLRYDPAITQQKQREVLAFYEALGMFYFVSGASPDPGIGIDGQWALKVNVSPWLIWYHTGGIWVAQSAVATGLNPTGAWSSATAYLKGDSVDSNGSSYACILAHTNHVPPNATYWQVVASKGNTGPAAWNLPSAWVTAHAYVAGPPADTVVQGNNTYVCLVSHTSGTFATDLAAGKWILAAAGAPIYNLSSTASLTIGTGSKAFTGVSTNNAYQVGDYLRAKSAANSANYMEGNVTANSGGTLTVNVTKVGGSGTFADWNISITGAPGTGDVLSTNNGSEFTNAATFASNLSLVRYAAQSLTLTQQAQVRANIGVTKKNYLINPGMQISLENGTTAGTTNNYHPADQWFLSLNSMGTGVISVAQVASLTPGGSTHRIRATVTAAQATVGGSSTYIAQKIEGLRSADLLAGTASAKNITVQLGIKAPVSGTYTVLVANVGVANFASGTFTIAGGEVGTDVIKSVTLALPTTGTWATDNTLGMSVYIYLMTSAQTANVFATNGNVFELFDVGLYEGTSAPPFTLPELVRELPMCERYWEKSYDYAIAPGSVSTGGCEGLSVGGPSGFVTMALFPRFGVRKRATPTVQVYSETTGASNKVRDRVNGVDVTPTAIDLIGEKGFRTYATLTASTVVSISCHWTSNARL